MQPADGPAYTEIDFRALLGVLLRRRWRIACVTLLVAVVTLGASLIWPKRYQATAQLVITQPVISTALSAGVQLSPRSPERKGLKDLATADDLIQALRRNAQKDGMLPSSLTHEVFRRRLNVTVVGDSQILLQVVTGNNQHAAIIANTWASELAGRLNQLFGVDKTSLGRIEQQATQARDTWASTETELTNFLAKTRLEALRVQVAQRRETLAIYLNKICGIDLLISDAQASESALTDRMETDRMPVGSVLGLIDLQRRAAGGSAGLQFQISAPSLMGEGYTVADARRTLRQLGQSLATQRQDLAGNLKQLDSEISTLSAELESADYQFARLTAQRDLSRRAYEALAGQAAGTKIALTHNGPTAKVAGQAQPPDRAIRPRPLRYTIIAVVLGFLSAAFAAVLAEWWRAPVAGPVQK